MTNEEAVCLIGSIQFDLTDGYYQREDYIEALCVFDRLNQENTKLKAEIEMYKQLVSKQADLNMEQFKQIAEQTRAIDNYNKALQSWNDANNNLLRLVGDLKDEIEQLKARIEADNVKKDFKEFFDKRDKEESKFRDVK